MQDTQATITIPLRDQLELAVSTIRARIRGRQPTVGLVLGSGLGGFADRLKNPVVIEYGDIPHFLVSSVEGHAGRLVVGEIGGLTCAAMQGRVHYYEGHDIKKVVFPVRTLVLLGCKTLIITNAAGAINPAYAPGDLVIIKDHLNLLPEHPLRGANEQSLGPRFPDMTFAYDPGLRELARAAGKEIGLDLAEGVYAAMSGPSYETPAEVRMERALGADLAGMSTVPEVIAANHMGARVLGVSCVTNMAAGITGQRLSHAEVTETGKRVRERFTGLLERVLFRIGQAR